MLVTVPALNVKMKDLNAQENWFLEDYTESAEDEDVWEPMISSPGEIFNAHENEDGDRGVLELLEELLQEHPYHKVAEDTDEEVSGDEGNLGPQDWRDPPWWTKSVGCTYSLKYMGGRSQGTSLTL